MSNFHSNTLAIPSETIERKFTDIQLASEWEVESESGWEAIESINKTIPYQVYRVIFSNGTVVECADTHIFINENHSQIFAKDSLHSKIISKEGPLEVVEVSPTQRWEEMYDLTVDSKDHTYFGNGILSHNSETTAACVLWYMLFQEYKTVAVLANKASTARIILGRIQSMYENLPKWMQVGVVEWNKGSFQLGNHNRCFGAATGGSAIRGESISFLICDEFAFIPENQAMDFFDSVYPTISSGKDSKIVMFSTPKGLNHFYKFWTEATEGTSEFVPFSIEWDDVPGRGPEFKEKTIATIGEESWRQEFEAVFLGSANTLISSKKLEQLPIKVPIKSEGGLRVYENPVKGHLYTLTVDVGRGIGGDYSTIQVIDITTTPYRQAAVFADNKLDYVKFTKVIYELGLLYNEGAVLVENNDLGEAVLTDLHWTYEYENIVFTREFKGHTDVTFANGSLGLKTNTRTKKQGCSALKLLIENDKLLVWDKQTIFELSMFTAHGNSYAAEDGYHDDLVMGLVIFAWLTQSQNFEEITNRTENWKEEVAEQFDLPFGLLDDGMSENFSEDQEFDDKYLQGFEKVETK